MAYFAHIEEYLGFWVIENRVSFSCFESNSLDDSIFITLNAQKRFTELIRPAVHGPGGCLLKMSIYLYSTLEIQLSL